MSDADLDLFKMTHRIAELERTLDEALRREAPLRMELARLRAIIENLYCQCPKKPGAILEVDSIESRIHAVCGKRIGPMVGDEEALAGPDGKP